MRRIHLQPADNAMLVQGMREIQEKLNLPTAFPAGVEVAATVAAANTRLPALDRTDIALITIDPAESMDLDQAMYVERLGDGYRVY